MNVFEKTAKINAVLAAAAGVGGALAWTQPSVAGSDLWWHLAAGREIWASGSIPDVDHFSFTFAGREWLNHEWLWDVAAWGAWSVHPEAVAWAALLLVAALLAAVFARAARASGSLLAAGAATWLVAAGAHWFIDLRPHVVTLLFVALLLLVRERPWAPWLWPPLVALWANLHAGFVFGVCAIGLDVGLRTALASWRAKRLVWSRAEWLSLALCLPALLLNPWGLRILEYPLSYLEPASPYRRLREWLPPGFSLDPRSFQGRFWWSAALAAAGAPRALRRDPYPVALAAVGFLMAFTSRRFIPLFGVIAAPLIAQALAAVQARALARWPLLATPRAALAGGLLGIAAAAWAWGGARLYPDLLERWTQADLYPQAAVRYLEALGPPRRILNNYSWGGYLMLHLPESRVYIDGRANTLYDGKLLDDYEALNSELEGRRARLAAYPPDAALVDAGRSMARLLASGPDAWVRIYADPVAEILLPPGSPLLRQPLPDPEQVLDGHPQLRIMRARRLRQAGELERARAELEDVIAEHPLYLIAYGDLAWLLCMQQDTRAAEGVIAAALDAMPRRAAMIHLLAAQAYEQAGELPRALAAYRRSLPVGPFEPDGPTLAQIARLERRLAEGPGAERSRQP